MALPPFRFTLGQLLKMIAVLAVFLALLRMPFGPPIVVIALVVAGFAIDRARGGAGFRGGILTSVVVHLAIGLLGRVTHEFLFEDPSRLTFQATLVGLMYYALIGWIWGVAVSTPCWLLASVRLSWNDEEPGGRDPVGRSTEGDFELHEVGFARTGGHRR
jgi:hypothetical protein